MLFWIIATVLALIVTASVIVPLMRSSASAETGDDPDIGLYRDQLAEVDRDLARGVLAAEEAETARTEIKRRILAADSTERRRGQTAPSGLSRSMAAATGIAVVGGGLGLYWLVGAPGYPDIPLAERIANSQAIRDGRPSQEQVVQALSAQPTAPRDMPPTFLAAAEELRGLVEDNPEDAGLLQRLARAEFALGNATAAAQAQTRAVELAGDAAQITDLEPLVIFMIEAAQGYISPESEAVLQRILTLDATNIPARFYYGQLFFETDRPDRAFRLWRDVVREGADDNPFTLLARRNVEEAAFRAGVEYTLPPLRGPSLNDIANAADMSDEDRMAMIQGMVDSLSTRLANEGGPVNDWANLIIALAQLGDTEQANTILREAREVFGAMPDAMEVLDLATARAGLSE